MSETLENKYLISHTESLIIYAYHLVIQEYTRNLGKDAKLQYEKKIKKNKNYSCKVVAD